MSLKENEAYFYFYCFSFFLLVLTDLMFYKKIRSWIHFPSETPPKDKPWEVLLPPGTFSTPHSFTNNQPDCFLASFSSCPLARARKGRCAPQLFVLSLCLLIPKTQTSRALEKAFPPTVQMRTDKRLWVPLPLITHLRTPEKWQCRSQDTSGNLNKELQLLFSQTGDIRNQI